MAASELRLRIRGMHCQGCIVSITEFVKEVPGVESVDIDLKAGLGVVRSPGTLDIARLIKAVKDAGYSAKPA